MVCTKLNYYAVCLKFDLIVPIFRKTLPSMYHLQNKHFLICKKCLGHFYYLKLGEAIKFEPLTSMGYEIEESNNLMFTYDFISNKWNEIGYLDQRGTHVHTCTFHQTKNDYRYLSKKFN